MTASEICENIFFADVSEARQCVNKFSSRPKWVQDSQAPVWVSYLPLVGTCYWPLVGVNLD